MVTAVADNDGKQRQASPWKTFAFFSGASLQLAVCIVVFGYLGQRLAVHWHHAWVTAVGVFFGVFVGASGLAFLAKQVLGDKL
ncbi:MAG: AtpZ/AtpI family protein [Alicyclobacillus shizuokensis]|nr:AtpZ/AtpI family protein [Alicyclobacillus shizuokensis]